MTDIEQRVVRTLLAGAQEITSAQIREWLQTSQRIVLTKKNFPNIRHLLESHMTAYRHGMCRGGWQWICVVAPKDWEQFKREVGSCESIIS